MVANEGVLVEALIKLLFNSNAIGFEEMFVAATRHDERGVVISSGELNVDLTLFICCETDKGIISKNSEIDMYNGVTRKLNWQSYSKKN